MKLSCPVFKLREKTKPIEGLILRVGRVQSKIVFNPLWVQQAIFITEFPVIRIFSKSGRIEEKDVLVLQNYKNGVPNGYGIKYAHVFPICLYNCRHHMPLMKSLVWKKSPGAASAACSGHIFPALSNLHNHSCANMIYHTKK